MASVNKDSKGWRIRFYDGTGERKQIRLAGINQGTADQIGRHVDILNAAKMAGEPLRERQTALWLQKSWRRSSPLWGFVQSRSLLPSF